MTMCTRHCIQNSSAFGAWRTVAFLWLCLWSVNIVFATPSRQRLQILLNHYTSSLQAQQEAMYNRSLKEETSRRQTSAEVGSPLGQSVYSHLHQTPRTDNQYLNYQRTFYGSAEGVNYLKKHYGANGLSQARADFGHNKYVDDLTKANKHFLTIRNTVKCSQPRPKVVRVKDYYPDPTKQYLPECTILHRCAESGCCEHEGLECVPRVVQEVDLFFYTINIFGSKGKDFGQVEKLLFTNHTECECQSINDLPRTVEETVEQQPPPKTHSQTPAPQHSHLQTDPPQSKCRDCPVPFYIREYPDGRCTCDCFDKQKPCLRIKRGREALQDIEKRCVDSLHCQIPDCEFGAYEHSTGRCPKRPNDLHRNDHRLHSQHHRWAAWERD